MNDQETRFATLQAALAQVDARLHLVVDDDGAVERILAIFRDSSASTIAHTDEPLLAETGLLDALREDGFTLISPPGDTRFDEQTGPPTLAQVDAWTKTLAGTDIGLTSALGIAEETGSMLLAPRVPDQRQVSLLPVTHVAVLRAEQVVPDIAALMARWQEMGDTNGPAVFVTGPSRTADIEKELVLGVHGPQAVDVILLV